MIILTCNTIDLEEGILTSFCNLSGIYIKSFYHNWLIILLTYACIQTVFLCDGKYSLHFIDITTTNVYIGDKTIIADQNSS